MQENLTPGLHIWPAVWCRTQGALLRIDRLVSQLCAFAPLVGELILECLVTWMGGGGVRSWESNASSLLYDTENIYCVSLVQLHTLAN